MQKVHQGVTESGKPGLFTGRYLAFGIPPQWGKMTHEKRAAFCKMLGFHLEGETWDPANPPKGLVEFLIRKKAADKLREGSYQEILAEVRRRQRARKK